MFLFIPVTNAFDWSRHVNNERFKPLERSYDWAVYFDIKTIKFRFNDDGVDKHMIDVWQRHYYISDRNKAKIFNELKRYGRASDKDMPAYEMYHCVYNLQNRTITPIQRIIYSENGTVLLNNNFKQEAIVIVPDTEPETWLNGIYEYVVANQEKVDVNTIVPIN